MNTHTHTHTARSVAFSSICKQIFLSYSFLSLFFSNKIVVFGSHLIQINFLLCNISLFSPFPLLAHLLSSLCTQWFFSFYYEILQDILLFQSFSLYISTVLLQCVVFYRCLYLYIFFPVIISLSPSLVFLSNLPLPKQQQFLAIISIKHCVYFINLFK